MRDEKSPFSPDGLFAGADKKTLTMIPATTGVPGRNGGCGGEEHGVSPPVEPHVAEVRPFQPSVGKRKIISVSGASKDIGKSSLAAFLASRCRACAGVKVSMHAERPPGEVIVVESELPSRPDTDTGRLRLAGAFPVLWVRSTPQSLARDIREAFSRLDKPVVIVEGNSVLRHLEPDFAVFVMSTTFEGFKPSAFEALRKAHTVVVNGEENISGREALELEREIKRLNPRAKPVLVSELGRERAREIVLSRAVGRIGGELMSAEVEERVLQAVREKAEENRLPCAAALKLAEELEVPPIEVGKAANALGIKIVKCSLGCF